MSCDQYKPHHDPPLLKILNGCSRGEKANFLAWLTRPRTCTLFQVWLTHFLHIKLHSSYITPLAFPQSLPSTIPSFLNAVPSIDEAGNVVTNTRNQLALAEADKEYSEKRNSGGSRIDGQAGAAAPTADRNQGRLEGREGQ